VTTLSSSPSEPIRVLHVITRLILGGAQENTLLTVEGLHRMPEYEVALVTGVDRGPEGSLEGRARRTTHLIILPELGRAIDPLSDLIALWKLYSLIRRGRYHIVHTHSSKAGVLGRVAARLAGAPIVVHTLHSLVFHDYQPWLVNRVLRTVKRLCAPLTDHYLSVSQLIAEKAIASRVAGPEKFTTVYSGMELDWFLQAPTDPTTIRRELGIPQDALVVGKIARLFPLKGHEQLLDAIPAVVQARPGVRFLLVGDGILQEALRARARELGVLDHLVFAGLVPREVIPSMISAMDLLVHTSLREGLARALPQAMAMGKPCVSFALDGAPEVVIDGETGYLVRPGDTAGLSAAMLRLLEDGELRRRMGEAGRRLVVDIFPAEKMVAATAAVYSDLVRRKLRRHGLRSAESASGPPARRSPTGNDDS
jgi:glycosyltransferase involved in cell wall biosynthesis